MDCFVMLAMVAIPRVVLRRTDKPSGKSDVSPHLESMSNSIDHWHQKCHLIIPSSSWDSACPLIALILSYLRREMDKFLALLSPCFAAIIHASLYTCIHIQAIKIFVWI